MKKKKQKSFCSSGATVGRAAEGNKSFFASFFSKKEGLLFLLLLAGPANAQPATPQSLGFVHFDKCPSDRDTLPLGDTITPQACLEACRAHAPAAGCWWLDGTGGFPRECRLCRTREPQHGPWRNDWALPFSPLVS